MLVDQRSKVRHILASVRFTSNPKFVFSVLRKLVKEVKNSVQVIIACTSVVNWE